MSKNAIIIMQPKQSIRLSNALIGQSLIGFGCTSGGIIYLETYYEKKSIFVL